MNVLVTGATGFIGTYVIKELLKHGHHIVATSRNLDTARAQDWFNKVTYVRWDIQEYSNKLFSLLEKPDCLIHLAWTGLPNYKDNFHFEKNLFDSYFFLKSLIKSGLRHILVAGTCLEYGLKSGALKEDIVPEPVTPYGLAKNTLRLFLQELQKQFHFQLQWVRLFYMYGQGQSKNSILSQLNTAIDNCDSEFNMSGGEQLRDYMQVEDVAKALVNICTNKNFDGIINCCSGKPISIRRLVENYLKAKAQSIKLNIGYYPYPDYEPMAFWGDVTKLNQIIGR